MVEYTDWLFCPWCPAYNRWRLPSAKLCHKPPIPDATSDPKTHPTQTVVIQYNASHVTPENASTQKKTQWNDQYNNYWYLGKRKLLAS